MAVMSVVILSLLYRKSRFEKTNPVPGPWALDLQTTELKLSAKKSTNKRSYNHWPWAPTITTREDPVGGLERWLSS